MENYCFKETNINPTGEKKYSQIYTVINSISIVTDKPWQEHVKRLIEQAHIRTNMPT